jgi:quinol monooxygenase YgiN
MTIVRQYSLTAAEGRETDLRNALAILAAQVRACEGSEKVETFADASDARRYVFMEYWRTSGERDAAGAMLGKAAFAPIAATLAERPEARDLVPAGDGAD